MPRHAAPLSARRGWTFAAFALALLAAAGCETREEYTLNPDGSGKVVFEIRNIPPAMAASFKGLNELKPGQPLPDAEERILRALLDEQRLNAMADFVEAFTDLKAGFADDGKAWVTGVAYFRELPDMADGRARQGMDYGHFLPLVLQEEGRTRLSLFHPPATPKEPEKPEAAPTDEQIAAWIAFQRPIMKASAEDRLRLRADYAYVRRVTVRLPGAPDAADAVGFAAPPPDAPDAAAPAQGPGTIMRAEYDSVAPLRDYLRRLDDDGWWRARLLAGQPTDVETQYAIRRTFETPPSVAFAVAEGAPALFDYEAEKKQAIERASDLAKEFAGLAGDAGRSPRLPRLVAQKPMPVAVSNANYTIQLNRNVHEMLRLRGRPVSLPIRGAAIAAPPPEPAAAPAAPEGAWNVTLVGAPLPARAYEVSAVALTECKDTDGKSLFNDQNQHVWGHLNNNTRFMPGLKRISGHYGGNNEFIPFVNISVNALKLPVDKPVIGSLKGRITFLTYDEIETVETDLFDPEPGAKVEKKGKGGDVELLSINDKRTAIKVRARFHRENAYVETVIRDAKDNVINASHSSSGGNNQYEIDFHFGEENAPKGKIKVALFLRQGMRRVVVPFEMKDVDLRSPPELPNPAADPEAAYVGDEGDTPPEDKTEEEFAIPRLPAKRAMPAAVFQATYTEAVALREYGLYRQSAGWSLLLYGAPLPARIFRADGLAITDFVLDDDSRVRVGNAHVNLQNSPWAEGYNRRHHNNENRIPSVQIYLNQVPMARGQTKIKRIAGSYNARTFAKEKAVELGEIELKKDQAIEKYDLRIKEVLNERRNVQIELTIPRETFGNLYFMDGEREIRPNYVSHYGNNTGRQTFALQFEHNDQPPEKVKAVLVERTGIRDIAVPFALEDIDLADLQPLPDPTGDQVAYVDDEDDRKETEAALADNTVRKVDDPRIPRLAANRTVPMAVLSTTYNTAAVDQQTANNLGIGHPSEGRQITLYGSPLPARTFMIQHAAVTRITLPDGRAVPMPDHIGANFLNNPYQQNHSNNESGPRAPTVLLTLPPLALKHDQTRLGRIEGRFTATLFAKEEAEELGEIELKQNARLGKRGFHIQSVNEGRNNMQFRFTGRPGEVARVVLKDGDRVLYPNSNNEINNAGDGQQYIYMYFNEGLPEKVKVELVVRKGMREVILPFKLEDIDLVALKPLPDPFADNDAKFVDDEEDRAAVLAGAYGVKEAEALRIPRLAANRPMPAAVLTSMFTKSSIDNATAQAQFGLNAGASGRQITLYGSPLPARTFAIKSARLTEARRQNGDEIPLGNPTIQYQYLNNPWDTSNNARRNQNQNQAVRLPVAHLTLPRLDIPNDATRLGTLAGQLVVRTYAKDSNVDLGELQVHRDATLEARNFRVRSVDNNRRNIHVEFDGVRDAFVRLAFYVDGEVELTPTNQNIGVNNNRLNARLYFNEPLPDLVEVVLVERAGMRDVEVPFRIDDIDLADPKPLPDPLQDKNGKFVDDEEDAAEALRLVREEIERQRAEAERKAAEAKKAAEDAKTQTTANTPNAPPPPEVF